MRLFLEEVKVCQFSPCSTVLMLRTRLCLKVETFCADKAKIYINILPFFVHSAFPFLTIVDLARLETPDPSLASPPSSTLLRWSATSLLMSLD